MSLPLPSMQTFHREEFPTLEYAAAKNIVLGEQQEAPPIITLPSSWVERAPVLFSAIVHAEADDGRNAPLREQMLQDRFQDELRKAAGVSQTHSLYNPF